MVYWKNIIVIIALAMAAGAQGVAFAQESATGTEEIAAAQVEGPAMVAATTTDEIIEAATTTVETVVPVVGPLEVSEVENENPVELPVEQIEEPAVSVDNVAPASINDLRVIRISAKSADIGWTAPGDNVKVTGYDIRISRAPIDESNWPQAIQLPKGANANDAGAQEVVGLSDLPSDATIYVAIKARDAAGNQSALSNLISFATEKEETAVAADENGNDLPLTPQNDGVAKIILSMPDGSVPQELIFVNFINQSNGLSFGSAVVNGLASVALPAGRYAVKLILPSNLSAPDSIPAFSIADGAAINLGVFKLNSGSNNDSIAASLANQGGNGIARILSFIVQLLFEILKQLQEISGKIGR